VPEGEFSTTFDTIIDRYRRIISRTPVGEDDAADGALASLAAMLADAHAGPRDVIMLHEAALQANAAEEAAENNGFDIAQCLLLIRVLGHLVAVYREHAPNS
jgi:hypothetical protein